MYAYSMVGSLVTRELMRRLSLRIDFGCTAGESIAAGRSDPDAVGLCTDGSLSGCKAAGVSFLAAVHRNTDVLACIAASTALEFQALPDHGVP